MTGKREKSMPVASTGALAAAARAAEKATAALAVRKTGRKRYDSDDELESAKKRKVDTEDKDDRETGDDEEE
jgi:hypothetical protein